MYGVFVCMYIQCWVDMIVCLYCLYPHTHTHTHTTYPNHCSETRFKTRSTGNEYSSGHKLSRYYILETSHLLSEGTCTLYLLSKPTAVLQSPLNDGPNNRTQPNLETSNTGLPLPYHTIHHPTRPTSSHSTTSDYLSIYSLGPRFTVCCAG